MADWYCFKDKEKMAEADLTMMYLDITQPIVGIRCPKCGLSFLTEETVTTKVHKGEEMIEKK